MEPDTDGDEKQTVRLSDGLLHQFPSGFPSSDDPMCQAQLGRNEAPILHYSGICSLYKYFFFTALLFLKLGKHASCFCVEKRQKDKHLIKN